MLSQNLFKFLTLAFKDFSALSKKLNHYNVIFFEKQVKELCIQQTKDPSRKNLKVFFFLIISGIHLMFFVSF